MILGGALFLQAWLVVGADVLAGHVRDIRRLWAVLALWCAPLLLAPPLFSRDVYSYFVQGKLVLSGGDPYTEGVASIPGWFRDGVDPMWQDTPTPYGPMFLSLSRGVAAFVGDNPYLAVIFFRLIALIGVALLAYYVPRLAFHCGIDASKALWLGVMNPLVLMHFVAGAHNDALMIGLIVAGFAVAIEGRPLVGVLVLSLGGMVKPIGLLALPFIGLVWAGTRADLKGRIVAWVKTAAAFVVAYLVLAALVGTSLGWIRALTTPGEVKTWLSPATALGMASGNLLSWIGLGDHLDTTVGVFRDPRRDRRHRDRRLPLPAAAGPHRRALADPRVRRRRRARSRRAALVPALGAAAGRRIRTLAEGDAGGRRAHGPVHALRPVRDERVRRQHPRAHRRPRDARVGRRGRSRGRRSPRASAPSSRGARSRTA